MLESFFQNFGRQFKFTSMPFVAYVKIWNEFFRDQNTQAPLTITQASDLINTHKLNEQCLKVNKLHDYFAVMYRQINFHLF